MNDVYHYRQRKDAFFRDDPSSPVEDAGFEALRYYPVTDSYIVRARVKVFDEQVRVDLATSTGESEGYLRYARARFKLEDATHMLTLYVPLGGDPERLFIPFKDRSNGKETYAAGRYLEAALADKNTLRLDFNYAYNPFCAYSPRYRCALPPEENHLNVAIRAGEKLYEETR